MKRERGGACSTSYPSGNQVDGLPLVAITRRAGDSSYLESNTKTVGKGKSRRPRTTVLLTMINMFLDVVASRSVFGNDIKAMYRIMRIQIEVSKLQSDRAISEFYRSRIFHGVQILMKILKIFKICEKNQD